MAVAEHIEEPTRAALALEGMTCASCAARIERKLNKLDGVRATVNYATEEASVEFDATRVQMPELVAAVESAGYYARPALSVARRSTPAGSCWQSWVWRSS